MKANMYFVIDFEEGKIFINKEYAKAASEVGSEEYSKLLRARNETGFVVEIRTIEVKKDQKRYSGLNYEVMENCIVHFFGKGSTPHFQFCEMKKTAKVTRGGYGVVKKWFLKTCEGYNTYEYISQFVNKKVESSQQATAASEADAVA